jgi:hypothetical protein
VQTSGNVMLFVRPRSNGALRTFISFHQLSSAFISFQSAFISFHQSSKFIKDSASLLSSQAVSVLPGIGVQLQGRTLRFGAMPQDTK